MSGPTQLHCSNIWQQHDCYHIHVIQCQHNLLKDLYKTYYYAWTSNRAIFRHLYNKSSLPHMCQVIFGSWQMYLPFCHFSEYSSQSFPNLTTNSHNFEIQRNVCQITFWPLDQKQNTVMTKENSSSNTLKSRDSHLTWHGSPAHNI